MDKITELLNADKSGTLEKSLGTARMIGKRLSSIPDRRASAPPEQSINNRKTSIACDNIEQNTSKRRTTSVTEDVGTPRKHTSVTGEIGTPRRRSSLTTENMPYDIDPYDTVEWNDKLEFAAKDIGENSKGYKLMHIAEAQKASTTYNRLMILGMCMGPFSGVISGIGVAVPSTPAIPIIATILGFLAGIIVAIIRFGKYDEYSLANKQAAARYTSIESNVRRQLSLYRFDRVPPTAYMEWLETKYEELFLSAPLLPAGVYDKYSSTAKKLGLTVPNQYDATITINNDYVTKNTNSSADIEVNSGDILPGDIEEGGIKATLPEVWVETTIKRSNTMAPVTDKMMEYEMKRMMGN